MSRAKGSRHPWLSRLGNRIWRQLFGDRQLFPRHMADPMWHLRTSSHRIRGGEIVVRFENLDADIRLDARSDLALRALGRGVYEPDLLAALPVVAGKGDAINVGANVGIIALAICRSLPRGRKLMCVEPLQECVGLLRANLDQHAGQNAIVVQAFAGTQSGGDRDMWTVPGKPEYSSGAPLVHASVRNAAAVVTTVPTVRLDDVVDTHALEPTLVVMDCEGGEAAALKGASRMVKNFSPVIILEFDATLLAANGANAGQLLNDLAVAGYTCWKLEAELLPATPDFRGTIIAVPALLESHFRPSLVSALDQPSKVSAS
jgi:FkbM family methyltransferase